MWRTHPNHTTIEITFIFNVNHFAPKQLQKEMQDILPADGEQINTDTNNMFLHFPPKQWISGLLRRVESVGLLR